MAYTKTQMIRHLTEKIKRIEAELAQCPDPQTELAQDRWVYLNHKLGRYKQQLRKAESE